MPKGQRHSQEVHEKLTKAFEAGYSRRLIAEELGIPIGSVYKFAGAWRRKNNIPMPKGIVGAAKARAKKTKGKAKGRTKKVNDSLAVFKDATASVSILKKLRSENNYLRWCLLGEQNGWFRKRNNEVIAEATK